MYVAVAHDCWNDRIYKAGFDTAQDAAKWLDNFTDHDRFELSYREEKDDDKKGISDAAAGAAAGIAGGRGLRARDLLPGND